MEIKILQVFLGADGLPYKDQERTVHFPIVGSGFQGASNTTKIRFYYDELVEQDDTETAWVACAKLPNGKIGSKVLETDYDSTLGEHYALLELDSFYFQYKGDVYISLQGYQGGVQVSYDEETELYTINGTPTIAATGSIKLSVNYATQFVGSGETSNVNFQRILADLGTKLGIRAQSEHVEELPSVGQNDIFYVVNDDPNNPNLQNIYVWNENTQSYVWVGDNTLDLGNYYTKQEGQAFEQDVNNQIDNIENQVQQVASGSPKGVYATLADLQTAYPTGTTGIYVVSADGHWYYWNGSAWTDGGAYLSSQDELDTYVVNKNILFGGYDETFTETGTSYVNIIKNIFIPKGSYITLSNLTDITTERGQFGWTYEDGTSATYPGAVKNMSLSFYAEKNIIRVGMYISHSTATLRIQVEPLITKNQNDIKELQNNFPPKNLFDKNAVVAGWIATNSGVINSGSNTSTSDYIPVKSNTTYILKMNMVGYYGSTGASRIPLFDENHNFVTYASGTLNNGILTFTTPIFSQTYGSYPVGNYRYCRFSTYTDQKDTVMMIEGDTYPSEYIGYGETLLASDIGLNAKQKQEVADAVPTNNLYGKYMAGCGDSIMESRTTGGMANGGAWEKIIGDRNDMQVNNIAKSGSTLANYYNDSNVFDATRTIYKQLETLGDTYDFIAFDGGVNDFAKNINLGSITTTYADGSSNYNCDTILGGLEAMCSRLVFHHPNAKKLFVFNHRIYANTDEKTNIGTWSYFVQQIKAVLEKWGIPYINLEVEVPPINMLGSSFKTTYTCNGDGWHPNELGYTTFYCDKIESKLRSL